MQVLEFAAFRQRLKASHTRLIAASEAAVQRLRAAALRSAAAGANPVAPLCLAAAAEAQTVSAHFPNLFVQYDSLSASTYNSSATGSTQREGSFQESDVTLSRANSHGNASTSGQAYTEGSGPPVSLFSNLDEPDLTARWLRFNEDLTVRPAWLPPSSKGPSLAVLDWWDGNAKPVTGLLKHRG